MDNFYIAYFYCLSSFQSLSIDSDIMLIISATDLKARSRTHYRAHKLSFWLHLVPDLMKNGYGVLSGTHHLLSNNNNGDGESSAGTHNSSATPPPPTIQLVGPPLGVWEHNTNNNINGKPRDHFFQGKPIIYFIMYNSIWIR